MRVIKSFGNNILLQICIVVAESRTGNERFIHRGKYRKCYPRGFLAYFTLVRKDKHDRAESS